MRDLALAISTLHDVTVLAPPSPQAPQEEEDGRIRVIRSPAPQKAARLLALNKTVGRLKREGVAPDIIHAHVFSVGALAVVVGRRHGLPVVITENNSDVLEGLLSKAGSLVAHFAYRNAASVFPDSPMMEACLREFEPRGHYVVVPELVDVDAFSDLTRERRSVPGRHILAVSDLIKRKGLDHLVEAVRMLVADGRNVVVTVVGEGPERPALEAQSTGLPIAFVGRRPRAEVIALTRTADVFAMPTLADPFGISAVEALAAQVPVVVSSAAGSADLVAAYGGRVVPPNDQGALHHALLELLDDPNSVPSGVASSLRGYCGSDAVARQLDLIYRSILRRPAISQS
jgi:glycosyltransferase involved in cell wall biosynthesis